MSLEHGLERCSQKGLRMEAHLFNAIDPVSCPVEGENSRLGFLAAIRILCLIGDNGLALVQPKLPQSLL